jgi:hypothetical protein
MTLVYLAVIAFKGGGFDYHSLWAILLSLFELAILIGLTILFSAITTPLAGALYSIIIIYIGHSLNLLKNYVVHSGTFVKGIANLVYYVFPNLEKFNIRNSVVYSISPSSSQIIYPIVYSILFSIILLWLATLALKQQDF